MSTQALKAAVSPKSDFPALLQKSMHEIARALPSHLKADRMARIALTAYRRTPALANCNPMSVLAAVIQSAQLGLEPDTLGRSYLIPYGSECQFVPGWKGLVDLVNRAGNSTVWTGAVYEGDTFDYSLGTDPAISHQPKGEDDPAKLLYAYAVGRVNGAQWPVIEVWTAARVKKHRDRYNKQGTRHYSFKQWEMYARKVVLLQVLKYMPMSPELSRALELDNAAEMGVQGLTIDMAVDGTYAPPAEEEQGQAPPGPTMTYAQVHEQLVKAKTLDQLHLAADLIKEVPEDQRAELGLVYTELKDKLK